MSTTVIAVAAQGPQGPAVRVRCLLPGTLTARDHGVEVDSQLLFSRDEAARFRAAGMSERAHIIKVARSRLVERLAQLPSDARTLVINRQADVTPSLAVEKLAVDGRRLVYDVDDAIWLDHRGAGGHPLAFLKGTRRKVDWLARRADHVVVGSEILAEYLAPRAARMSIVPSLVDTDSADVRRHEDAETVVVGWIGSPSTAAYLRRIAAPLERLAQELAPRALELLVVGGPAPRLKGVRCTTVQWSEQNERDALARMDIGVMPLPDTPWTRGKCAYKALQYMACGVPAVVDDVGVSARAVGASGRVVRDETEWFEAMLELAGSATLRQRLGERARERVEAEYSLRRWGPTLAEIWRGSADANVPAPATAERLSPASLIVTVRNDREGLEDLLGALAQQTEMPDEIVLVDGGSTDGTARVAEAWQQTLCPLHLIEAPGANIAAGRNIAVRAARHDWIVCTDAGCRPAPGWLAALQRERGRADIVAGVFEVEGDAPLERAVAYTHYPLLEEIHDRALLVRLSHRLFGRDFRASHAGGRSMAFSRDAWQAAGGFPERVYAGEDLAFSAAAIERGFRARLAEEAIVAWRPRATWLENARMFQTYTRGDVRTAGRVRHAARLLAWTIGPLVAAKGGRHGRAAVTVAAFAYVWLPLRRARRHRMPIVQRWRIPALVVVKDLAQLVGSGLGLFDALRDRPQPAPDHQRHH